MKKPLSRAIKKVYITSRVSHKFKKDADARAIELDMSTSEYIRRLIEDDLKAKKESE